MYSHTHNSLARNNFGIGIDFDYSLDDLFSWQAELGGRAGGVRLPPPPPPHQPTDLTLNV